MILSCDTNNREWKVTNKKLVFNQTWYDGKVSQNGSFSCTCAQYEKYNHLILECTHIKQVKKHLNKFH